jgi:hypothetical protein
MTEGTRRSFSRSFKLELVERFNPTWRDLFDDLD